jgi:hypothetical protein
MARAAAELLAVSVVRGPVLGGGCTAYPPPVVPGTNAPGLLDFDVDVDDVVEWPCDFLA